MMRNLLEKYMEDENSITEEEHALRAAAVMDGYHSDDCWFFFK
jgi:hypothetical protein